MLKNKCDEKIEDDDEVIADNIHGVILEPKEVILN